MPREQRQRQLVSQFPPASRNATHTRFTWTRCPHVPCDWSKTQKNEDSLGVSRVSAPSYKTSVDRDNGDAETRRNPNPAPLDTEGPRFAPGLFSVTPGGCCQSVSHAAGLSVCQSPQGAVCLSVSQSRRGRAPLRFFGRRGLQAPSLRNRPRSP